MADQPRPQPFNEPAALRELERLADKIQATRRQREQAVAEFDAFVKTFRQPAPELVRVPVPAPAAVTRSTPPIVAPPALIEPPLVVPTASVFVTPIPVSAPPVRVEAPERTAAAMPPATRTRYIAIGVAVFVLIVAGFLLVRSWRNAQSASSSSPASGVPTAGAPGPAPSPTAGAVTPRALNIELTTVRPVWMRVTVDDRRALEREVAVGQRLSFGADRSISIRAGDAGAVRLTVNGRDEGPLGRDGWPATRTLAPPQPTGR